MWSMAWGTRVYLCDVSRIMFFVLPRSAVEDGIGGEGLRAGHSGFGWTSGVFGKGVGVGVELSMQDSAGLCDVNTIVK
jgi:hypothetical protein